MFKRTAVLLLLFVLAGQASTVVCQCLTADEDQHSCCKREIGRDNVLSTPPCCDTGCVQSSSTAPQWNSDSQFRKITVKAEVAHPQAANYLVRAAFYWQPPISPSHFNNRLTLARPPRLYLRHHSFLI